VLERDKAGTEVSLGGSYVNNLADNLLLFGMAKGSSNLFDATYTKFGDVAVQQYPELIPSYPKTEDILDTSYLKDIGGSMQTAEVQAAAPKYDETAAKTDSPKNIVGRRSWNITFDTGRASFTPEAEQVLEQLQRELLVAGGTTIQIHGHTDNVGSSDGNQRLSEERAFAVKQWLMDKSSVNFPSERMTVFAHGATNPIAPNSTPEGKAKNRRVEIVLVSGS